MMTPTPIWRGTTLNPIAGEMTFRRGPGDIVSREIVRAGQDVVVETRIMGPEVSIDLANNPLHPPETSFRVAPEVEESIRREDVRRSRMSRTLMDTSVTLTRNVSMQVVAYTELRLGLADAERRPWLWQHRHNK